MNYFNDLISNDEHFIDMPDCIADGSSYEETIEKSFKITNGILNLNEFSWSNNNGRFEFNMVVNGKPANFSVEIMSDYIDSNGLIEGLNKILQENGYKGERNFCDINGGVADFGVAFISKEKEKELASQGMIYREQY